MASRKEFTHRGQIRKPSLGWGWSEQLRETDRHWISGRNHTNGEIVKYRKKDGKRLGGEDILDLTSIKECH